MKIRFKFINILAIFITLILCFYIIYDANGERYSFLVLSLSYIISSFSILFYFMDDGRAYSLRKVFYLFFLFFIGVAPAIQFKNNITFVGMPQFSEYDYIFSYLIFLIVLIVFEAVYRLSKFSNSNRDFKNRNSYLSKNLHVTNQSRIIVISLVSLTIIVAINGFSLNSILFRQYSLLNFGILSQPITQIVETFIRPIPIIALMLHKKCRKKISITELLLILIVLATNSPLAMPRFKVAALYLPLLIIYFPRFDKGMHFSFILMVGLIFLFPTLNIFRGVHNVDDVFEGFLSKIINNITNSFSEGHYDSFNTAQYVFKNNILTYGKQLLGVFFFFVPRFLWANKPTGSGHFIATTNSFTFSNMSMNFFGEGYINFGIVGIFVFTLFLARLCAYLDNKYWNSITMSNLGDLLYLLFLGILLFILRGDLLSSIAYTTGLVLAVTFVYLSVTQKIYLTNDAYKNMNDK